MSGILASIAGAISNTLSVAPSDDLSITVIGFTGNVFTLQGWQGIKLTRSMTQFPSSFELEMTEMNPNSTVIMADRGDQCFIMIGGTLVLTGYIDRYAASVTSDSHTVNISGRSMCEDIFDCGPGGGPGQQPTGMVPITSALNYAQKLATPYGIQVVQQGTGNGMTYPNLAGNLTETCYRLIETVARYSALLVMDDVHGNLVLAEVGAGTMASGFSIPGNVQSAHVNFSMDGRFSEYNIVVNAVGDMLTQFGVSNLEAKATDEFVSRYRPIFIQCEQLQQNLDLASQRANWEKNHRLGQSYAIQMVVDSWRDLSGVLWQPNYYAPIYCPQVKIISQSEWVIETVTYCRDEKSGTTAEITMKPWQAFTIEPVIPQNALTTQILNGGQTPATSTAPATAISNPEGGPTNPIVSVPGGAPT